MKKLKFLCLLLVLSLSLSSCRPFNEVSFSGKIETWADVFSSYWHKMNTNYVFWDIEDINWDDIYDQYMPKFEALGLIEDENKSSDELYSNLITACRYFYEIIIKLHDGHYILALWAPIWGDTGPLYTLNPNIYREMISLGYSEEEVFNSIFMTDEEMEEAIKNYFLMIEETTANIYSYTFSPGKIASSYGFNKVNYIESEDGALNILYSKSDDGIVYFSFNCFYFSYYSDEKIDQALSWLENEIGKSDTKAVVIDLRGNSGGFAIDLNKFCIPFLPESGNVHFADTKRKGGDNRTDYGPWLPFYISRDENEECYPFNKDIPIAILQNRISASASELTIMFFKALREDYGYNVRTFGDISDGANGAYLEENSEYNYNAGTTAISYYISYMQTPYCQLRYKDGTIYEGVGIEADEYVEYDYEAFKKRGEDPRLKAALDWAISESEK